MRIRFALVATSILGFPILASAQPITGLYIGAGALWNFKQTEHIQDSPGLGIASGSRFRFDEGGFGGLGSVGYGLGNGLRFEIEGDYRQNSVLQRGGTARPELFQTSTQEDYGVMGNVLYDVDLRPLGVSFMSPYVGLGAGYQWSHLNGLNAINPANGNLYRDGGTSGNLAYQGIAGVAFPIASVPGLALTAEYRFLGILGNEQFSGSIVNGNGSGIRKGNIDITENLNHSVVVGIRYAFNTPSPPPPPAPVTPVPAPAPSRTYLVFFDWDRSDLSDRARQIVSEAAQASTRVQTTRIEVQGNADRSGTPQYNQRLSLRRAQTVAAELVRDGVPNTEIQIEAFGDTRPLVPTAPGVREPQNRRVAIILR
jgi:outer membrane protein OmpA-like peptidoglycan-associated protein